MSRCPSHTVLMLGKYAEGLPSEAVAVLDADDLQRKRCALVEGHVEDHAWLESTAVIGVSPIVARWTNDSPTIKLFDLGTTFTVHIPKMYELAECTR